MKKVLLIGAKGQVGQELQVTLPQLGEVISIGREELDLTNSEKIGQLIREIHPNYLINASAYTAVDKAETEPDLAYSINATAPKIMAESAEKIKAKFLHISTDYVFDGRKNTPYLETDLTNPDNPPGIYNFTNSGVASWFDLTKAIFEEAKISGIPLKIQRVIPITSAEYPTPAVRPAYSVLSGQKISQQLGYIPPYWRDSLKAMLNQLFNL